MKRRGRIVRHPDAIRGTLLGSSGRGGPAPGPGGVLGPAHPVNPVAPGNPSANAAGSAANQATKAIGDALGTGIAQAVQSIIGPGQVLLGIVLVAAGLLLATGQMGRLARGAGRAGLFAATRGAVR